MRKLNEFIVAIRSSCVNHLAGVTGIVRGYELQESDIVLAQREYLETTNEYRQVLPVIVFTNGSKVWAYKRTKKGNEKGLHDQVSVAVGGHWDMEDLVTEGSEILVQSSMFAAMDREIEEEVDLHGQAVTSLQPLCTLAASETVVDEKHIAFIYECELELPEVSAKEDELESMGFVDPVDLLASHEAGEIHLETWALVACKKLIDLR